MRLDEKRVVIIGGSSGIGLETARLAIAQGASVTIAGRSEDRLRRAAADLGSAYEDAAGPSPKGRLRCVVADVAQDASIRSLFDGESRVDHVFVPAGELKLGSADVSTADLEKMGELVTARLLGVAHVVRHARPKMGDGGSITLMSGLYSTRPAAGVAMGAAAIAGVEGMTRALALDLAPIRVNAVAPGLIETPLWDALGTLRDSLVTLGPKLPVGRIGRPEEVAEAVVFLMTNGFITGTILPIDGGGALI
jgi:NAD(P)-dependent dehydrogenase (short-subunit alcohol dehydrogenase family)